jgi:hypothetical protein
MMRPNILFVKIILIFILFFSLSIYCIAQTQEEMIISTYLPPPVAAYEQLRTRNLAIGDQFIDNLSLYCWAGGCANVIDANARLVIAGNLGINSLDEDAEFRLSLDDDGGIVARGAFGQGETLGDIQTVGRPVWFFWYPRRAAIRAGGLTFDTTYWNDANIGDYSVGFGEDTIANQASATVSGGQDNEASGQYATVSGGQNNIASGQYATVAGGTGNDATALNAFVGGGDNNTASWICAAVGGGQNNIAGGMSSFIGGGLGNNIPGSGVGAAVLGGEANTASGWYSIVCGGLNNIASGNYSTVAAGEGNQTAADYSWVGGKNIRLSNLADNTFAWGYNDTFEATDLINTPNAFLVFPYAEGNMGINTLDPDNGHRLDVKGIIRCSDWEPSDIRLKKHIKNINQAIEQIDELNGIYFKWDKKLPNEATPDSSSDKKQIGLIAQEVEKVLPQLVSTASADGYKSIDYGRLNAVLLEAIKELKIEQDQLERQIGILEKKKAKRL